MVRGAVLPLLVSATLLLLVSCSSRGPIVAPMDVTGEMQTVWDYLASKYDVDRDGRIVAAEYVRDSDGFERLDANQDGVLTEADFNADTAEAGSLSREELRAVMAVMIYFQGTERVQVLTLDELQTALDDYDANQDGLVARDEFLALAGERRARLTEEGRMLETMLDGADPWEALVALLDEDEDRSLARAEVRSFFEEQAEGEGVWDFSGPGDDAGEEAMSGPAPGTMAPDFELRPPDGGTPVRLSSYREKRPVALIFGSYT